MKSVLSRKNLQVKKSSIHGYGVFAEQHIEKDDVIEECHLIIIREKNSDVTDYTFGLGKAIFLSLGNGSIYNHSLEPNANFIFDEEHFLLRFIALRPIKKGEEIFIFYGKEWFSSREIEAKDASFLFKLRRSLSSMRVLVKALFVTTVLFGLIKLLQCI